MSSANIDSIKKADVIRGIVARCIDDKAWRSTCENECMAYASKAERAVVKAYIREQYNAAGAGFLGRWTPEERFGRKGDA